MHVAHAYFSMSTLIYIDLLFIIDADGSWVSIAIIRICIILCVCVWFCPSVSPHDKIKTAETKIAKLGTEVIHHDTSPTN